MENSTVRTRYPRHNVTGRRRQSEKCSRHFYDKLAMQVVVCIVILTAAAVIKNTETKPANFVSDKLKAVLSWNIEIKSMYAGFEKLADVFSKEAVPEASDDESAEAESEPKESSSQEAALPQASEAVQEAAADFFALPVNGTLGSEFGTRTDPLTKKVSTHKGIDIAAGMGAQIKASAAGKVIETGFEADLGNYIKLSHDQGFTTLYAHCSKVIGKKDQQVKQGDIIAQVGSTGQSTGPHLHFEIWKDGKAQNPLDFITVSEK